MLTNSHRLLRNSPPWRQFKIRSANRKCILFPVHYFLFIQKPCQIIVRRIEINIISIVKRIFYLFIYRSDLIIRAEAVTSVSALMIGQAIPQDNRIAHKNMEQSKQEKYCFNLPNNA